MLCHSTLGYSTSGHSTLSHSTFGQTGFCKEISRPKGQSGPLSKILRGQRRNGNMSVSYKMIKRNVFGRILKENWDCWEEKETCFLHGTILKEPGSGGKIWVTIRDTEVIPSGKINETLLQFYCSLPLQLSLQEIFWALLFPLCTLFFSQLVGLLYFIF